MLKKPKWAAAVILILALLSFLYVLPGCKVNETESQDPVVTLIDGIGNTVELSGPAEKIIVLVPSVLEIIDALGAMELVVEVDNFSVSVADPLAEGFEGAGDSYGPNVERIAELDPDILLTLSGTGDEYQAIEDLGIKIYNTININGIEGVYEEITNIGKIVGLEDKAEELNNNLEEGVDEIYSKVKDLSDDERPRVFYIVWSEPLSSAGMDTFINDIIKKSGGINILEEDGLEGWPEYSMEVLIDRNPDIIIAPIMAVAGDSSTIMEDQKFSSIDAVVNGRVYVVPDNPISRPNQNVIKAIQMFSKAIHPEIFGEFEIIE